MILWTRVTLATEPRRSFALFGLVIAEHIVGVLPPGVFTDCVAVLVEIGHQDTVGVDLASILTKNFSLNFPNVVNRVPQVVKAMRKRTVGPILNAVAAGVRVIDTDPRLVIAQMVSPFRVSGRAVEERTPVK